jgi:hypothetical protein
VLMAGNADGVVERATLNTARRTCHRDFRLAGTFSGE